MLSDFLLTLAVAWLCFPWAFFFAGCPCCPEGDCDACTGGASTSRIQAVIAGITNGTCSDCAATFNGTFILDVLTIAENFCQIRYPFTTTCNSSNLFYNAQAELPPFIFTNAAVHFDNTNAAEAITWKKFYFSDPTVDETTDGDGGCLYDSTSIPKTGSPTICDHSSSTCHITAI